MASNTAAVSDGSERRRHARFDVMAQVRVKRGRTSLILEVLNISESGAFLDLDDMERPKWLTIGTTVELIAFIPREVEVAISISTWATIVRIVEGPEGMGFAVQFEDVGEDMANAVGLLIEQAAPKPPPLPKKS